MSQYQVLFTGIMTESELLIFAVELGYSANPPSGQDAFNYQAIREYLGDRGFAVVQGEQ